VGEHRRKAHGEVRGRACRVLRGDREQLDEAHGRDFAIEADEGVHFERAWLDPDAGKAFCLSTGPSKESVMRIHERAGHPTGEVYELSIEV
jgi:hypothetical protein